MKTLLLSGPLLSLAKSVRETHASLTRELEAIEQNALAAVKTARDKKLPLIDNGIAHIFDALGIPKEHHDEFALQTEYIDEHSHAYVLARSPFAENLLASLGKPEIVTN